MEEIRWNFPDANHIMVKFLDTGRELYIKGDIMSDNHTFVASARDIQNCIFLSASEKRWLKDTLFNRTRNDEVRIMFDY